MNLLLLTLSYLRRRPLTAALNVVLLALGVATIVMLLLFTDQMARNLSRDAQGIDLVVGAKGSPLQLILSSIYHVDAPTGNISVREARTVVASGAVAEAIPLSLGDSYAGFPIVGTTRAYPARYDAALAAGAWWAAPLDAVLGADVAGATGLGVGDTFASTHGLSTAGQAHGDHAFEVSGVLAPTGTVIDRLVLTSLETVWDVHGAHATAIHENEGDAHGTLHGDEGALASIPPAAGMVDRAGLRAVDERREITALLISYSSPMAAALFPRAVNGMDNLVAASPAMEIGRLTSLLGVGVGVVRAFGWLLIAASFLGVFVTLYSALRERRYDLALLRTLGMPRVKLLLHVLLEGVLLALLGLVLGLLLGHVGASMLGQVIESEQGFRLTGWAWHPSEGYVVLLALGVGALAALLPAWQAYRTDLARTLAAG